MLNEQDAKKRVADLVKIDENFIKTQVTTQDVLNVAYCEANGVVRLAFHLDIISEKEMLEYTERLADAFSKGLRTVIAKTHSES